MMDDGATTEQNPDTTETPTKTPENTVNIREVKEKTLTLLTSLYRKESGDVRRMAMSLLQTLYTIEDQSQVAQMNEKIQKLMNLIEDQKREAAEMEEASIANSHASFDTFDEAPALTDETNLGEHVSISGEKPATDDEEGGSVTSTQSQASKGGEGNRWRWQGKFRKPEPARSNEENEAPQRNVAQRNWKESRERWMNGWHWSTTKRQQNLTGKNLDAEDTGDSSSTECSSSLPSASDSESSPDNTESAAAQEDLMDAIRNFVVMDGDKESWASLEGALVARREKARGRLAAVRARWGRRTSTKP